MPALLACAQRRAQRPESLRITFDVLEQRRRRAKVITASRDRAHFEIPIDWYFDPLNFVELLQQFQKISEVIHFHCSLLAGQARPPPEWEAEQTQVRTCVTRSFLQQRSKLILSSLTHLRQLHGTRRARLGILWWTK